MIGNFFDKFEPDATFLGVFELVTCGSTQVSEGPSGMRSPKVLSGIEVRVI